MAEELVFAEAGVEPRKLTGGPGEYFGSAPKVQDPDFLVGFDQSDDAAVYRLTDELALVHTLDFFPMVEDPIPSARLLPPTP